MKPRELKLSCECLEGKYCARLVIYEVSKEWIEVNLETLIKGRRKTLGGVVVNKKDLIDFCNN